MASTKRPPTAGAFVLAELRRWISEGELRPGDQIMADAIGERLGMSRVPVREALRLLEGEGQVSYEPHRGYFVAELTLDDLLELYRIRHLLETEALRLTVPALAAEDFQRMEEALTDLKAAHEHGDILKHVSANRRFHLAFLAPLTLPRLSRYISVLYDSCDSYGSLYYNVKENRDRSRREHRQLFAAAKRHDTDRVIEVLELHRKGVIDALSGVLAAAEAADADLSVGFNPPSRPVSATRSQHAPIAKSRARSG